MSKELKIKGGLSKDYQQIYIDDEPIGVYLNEEGKVKLKDIVVSGELKASQEALVIKNNSDGNGSDIKTDGSLTLDLDGNLIVSGADVKIDALQKIYLDGGTDTYIVEASNDVVRYYVGNDRMMIMSENGADGNQVYFESSSVGFQQLEPTYNASNTIVDFRHSNKQHLTFVGGDIIHIQLFFPNMSGNFQLLVKQDGTGSRTVTGTYKVYEFDESVADGEGAVKWAGGSAPILTTDANHVDILSFYWDADNEIAYGVATLDFQF